MFTVVSIHASVRHWNNTKELLDACSVIGEDLRLPEGGGAMK